MRDCTMTKVLFQGFFLGPELGYLTVKSDLLQPVLVILLALL